MKMIRWSGLIAFVIIVGLIAAFNLLFLDGIVKGIVEDQASLAVGARVDIGHLNLKLLGLRVDIRDVQAANPEQPMRNAVEVGALGFDLAAAPLLRKKIVIQHMKVVDLAWNTVRETSGALPARLQKKLKARKERVAVEPTAKKRVEDCVLPDFSSLADLKKRSPEDLLAGANLQSVASVADYRKRVSDAKGSWEKRLADLPTQEGIEADLKDLQSLKDQPPTDVTQLPAHLEKVQKVQQKLKDVRENLVTAQQEFQAEMNGLKASLKEVEKLKEQDVKDVMAKLGIPIPSAVDLICVLLGKDVAQKVNWALAWYGKLGGFMPTGKPKGEKEEPVPTPRLKGVDVRFPTTRGYPDFLLETAEFSARPEVKEAPGKFAFAKLAGDLHGLTTHPALYGKPTVFELKGSFVGDTAKEVVLSGQLDHRSAPTDDRIDLIIKELRMEQPEVATPSESPLRLTSAILNVLGYVRSKGDALNGRFFVDVRQPKVAVGPTAAVLTNLFKNMGRFDITLSIGGTLDQPSMSLSSSATESLASGLQNLVQTELKGIQSGIKKAITSRVDPDMTAAGGETDALEKGVLGELTGRMNLTRRIPTKEKGKEKPDTEEKPTDLLKEKGLRLPF